MDLETIRANGLVLVGCGKMGSAMLAGWLEAGVPATSVWVIDPHPSDWLQGLAGLHLNQGLPSAPAVLLVAVKPQMMQEALPQVAAIGGGETLVISVAAGTPLAHFEQIFGPQTPIVRAMPNTPAAIGQGITAYVGNAATVPAHLALADTLLGAVGQTVALTSEGQLDAVTALSGSGPAYVFYMIECMTQAGQDLGLPADMALRLATATVAGAGALAQQASEDPAQLRKNVTSPNGTTQAALSKLMAFDDGLAPLMARAMQAAADRSKELSNG